MKIMKTNKKFTLIGLCAAACVGFSFAGVTVANANESATPVVVTAPQSFAMTNGASIRLGDATSTAIRFRASISKQDYVDFIENYGKENVEFGMCIARTTSVATLKSYDLDKTAFPMQAWDPDYNPSIESATEYRYCFAVYNIDAANFNRSYTTLAYAKVTTTDATNPVQYVYASYEEGETTRTPFQVAAGAKINGAENATVDSIIDNVMDGIGSTFAFEESAYTVKLGEKAKLQTTLTSTEGTLPVDAKYTVESESIAKIVESKDAAGNIVNVEVEGVSAGTTTVTATISGSEGKTWTKTVDVTVEKGTITPTIEKGVLTLNANGEAATVALYAGEEKKTEVTLDAGTTTYDVREMAISYMEKNAVTSATQYTVKVSCASGEGEVATETYVPLTSSNFHSTLNTLTSAAAVSGKYYFMTENASITDRFRWNQTVCGTCAFGTLYGDLDGRGYTLTVKGEVPTTSSQYAGIATNFYANWKNVVVDMSVKVQGNACTGLLGYAVYGTFNNCYFMMNIDNRVSNNVYFGTSVRGKFYNCIIELNDLNTEDEYSVYLRGNEAALGALFDGVALIVNEPTTSVLHPTNIGVITLRDFYQYTSIEAFMKGQGAKQQTITGDTTALSDVTGVKYSAWPTAWTISETGIKLCGKTVIEPPTAITPTIANGILTLNTNGQATTVALYSGDTELTSVKLAADTTTYDVREMAISYMESKKVTAETAYTVKVSSRNYAGETTTESYVPLSSVDNIAFYNTVSGFSTADQASGRYMFMTGNITISSNRFHWGGNSGNGGTGTWNTVYGGLDGRGYSITINGTTTEQYCGFFWSFYGEWENVVFVQNAVLSSGTRCRGMLGYIIQGTFTNCYFDMNATNNTGYDVYLWTSCNVGERNILKSCIVDLADQAGANNLYLAGGETAFSVYTDVVVIVKEASVNVLAQGRVGYMDTKSLYQYTSLSAFVTGGTGYDQTAETSLTETTGKKYEKWDSVWTISETEIQLCGKTVKTVS